MKKRSVVEEAYRIYWALGTLVGRASALSGDNDRKIACRIFFAIAARGAGWIHGQSGPGKAGEAVATEWPKADNRKSRVR